MAGAGNIRMNPDEMEKRAKQFNKSNDDFNAVVKAMRNEVKSLEAEWEGQSSKAFSDQFTQLEPSFKKTSDLINDIATQLRSIAKAMKDTDDQIASKIGVK